MDKRNVLFVVHGLWRGGAETQLVELVNRLPADRFRKSIFSYREGDDLKDDVRTEEVSLFKAKKKSRLDLGVAREIARIIDEQKIDIVHCTMRNAMLFGYFGIRLAKRRPGLIVAVHSTKNANRTLDLADRMVYRFVLRRCTRVWFVSDRQADLWTGKMPFLASKAVTIHNGVDHQVFDASQCEAEGRDLRASLGIGRDENVICSVAGFRPVKLHSVLIDALGKIVASGRRCHLLLAGSGALEQELRTQVQDLGLESVVHFLGNLPDVRPVLAASDCMSLVSEAETLSMAMLEAMAMGVPVITTIVGGASEAIENQVNGFLIPPNDVNTLADTLRYVLADDDRRTAIGKAAREAVIRGFTVSKMTDDSAESLLATPATN